VTAQTHVATAHAVEVVGARAVFVDCRAQDGNIDPDLIEEAITSRTRAIALVHFLGIPCDMRRVLAIAEHHGLKLVEDCALAVGTRYEGKHVGYLVMRPVSRSIPSSTSRPGTWHVRVASPGAREARCQGAGVRCRSRILGTHHSRMYDVPVLGINYRLSDINSAIGRKQLERVQIILERRESNFRALPRVSRSCPMSRSWTCCRMQTGAAGIA